MLAITQTSPKLNKQELELVTANASPLVVSMDKSELSSRIIDILSNISNALGQQMRPADMKAQTIGLIAEIGAYFKKLTIEELDIALKNGIRGEYGEYFGLNVITYHKFIKASLLAEKRRDALVKQMEFIEDQNRAKTEKDIERIESEFWENEKNRFQKFKETGKFYGDSPSTIFGIYESKGKISLTTSEKWVYFNHARQIIVESLNRQLGIGMDTRPIKQTLNRINNGEMTSSDNLLIKDKACELAIIAHFKTQTP